MASKTRAVLALLVRRSAAFGSALLLALCVVVLAMGEPNPAMQYALTTEGVAKTAMRLGRSPAQDPTAPVYVVVLKGTFTRNWGSPKAPTVAGTTLALEFASQRDAAVNGPLALSGTVDTSRLGALSSFTQ